MSGEIAAIPLFDELPTAPSPSKAEMRERILAIESAMLAMPEHQIEFEVRHHFAPGVYMRELHIPKGATLTGKIHKTEHMNILSQGELAVWTEDGMKVLRASTVIKSQPGTKRVGHALEDTVWITVHHNPDDSQDLAVIEERVIAKTFAEAIEFAERKSITQGGE